MKHFVLSLLLFIPLAIIAQINADVAHNQAFELAKKGDIQKALDVVKKAEASDKDNAVLLKDIAYYTYLSGDAAKAADYARDIVSKNIADEQVYQILGSSLRRAKKYDESIDAYGQGITKYPKSAILYAELGDTYIDNGDPEQAVAIWEKGTKIDPNISNNYYNLARAYAKNMNPLKAIITGETFINMENKSNRAVEIRNLMLEQYKVLFSNASALNRYLNGKNNFEKKIAESYKKYAMVVSEGITPESLSALRSQFAVDWFQQGNENQFPFALFDRYRVMLKSGIFDAYNRWLFSGYNPSQFRSWGQMNKGQMNEFTRYFNASMLKFPEGGQSYL